MVYLINIGWYMKGIKIWNSYVAMKSKKDEFKVNKIG